LFEFELDSLSFKSREDLLSALDLSLDKLESLAADGADGGVILRAIEVTGFLKLCHRQVPIANSAALALLCYC
jgi:hypothetical protein